MSDLDRDRLDQLAHDTAGDVLRPGLDGYDDAREVWKVRFNRNPACIVRCRQVGDVAKGLRFARAEGLPLSVKGGGRVAPDATAYPDRSSTHELHVFPGWIDPGHDEEIMAWADAFHEAMTPYGNGNVHVNLLGDGETERIPAASRPFLEVHHLRESLPSDAGAASAVGSSRKRNRSGPSAATA